MIKQKPFDDICNRIIVGLQCFTKVEKPHMPTIDSCAHVALLGQIQPIPASTKLRMARHSLTRWLSLSVCSGASLIWMGTNPEDLRAQRLR